MTIVVVQCRLNSSRLPKKALFSLGGKTVLVRLDGNTQQIDLAADNDLPKDLELLILTVLSNYVYLL